MGESDNRTYGVLYVISGLWFSVYFLLNRGVRGALFGIWIYPPPPRVFFSYLIVFLFILVLVVSAFVLVVFGIVLVLRGGVFVARVSRFFFVCLVIYYLWLIVEPFLIGGCVSIYYCGPEV